MWEKFLRGQTFSQWLIELLKFCTVGLGAYVVDVGIFNFLAYYAPFTLPGDAPMVAKTISVIVAIIFSWIVNRLWTFKNRSNKSKSTEFFLFLIINVGGLLIALGCLATSRFLLGFDSQLADNIAANGVGLVLGTAFRYVCYRYLVFTAAPGAPQPPHPAEIPGSDRAL